MKKSLFLLIISFVSSSYAANADEKYMQQLLPLAHKNPKAPFSAIIVENKSGKILCEGLNHTAENPTYHGEIVAINNCAKAYPNLDWSTTTLYTTAEPCPMCESAIIWAGIAKVVYGTSIETLKKEGWHQIDISSQEVASKANFYHGTTVGGILASETDKLFVRK